MKLLILFNNQPLIYDVESSETTQEILSSLGVSDPSLYQEFSESDFDPACYSFVSAFSLAEGVVSFNLPDAKVQASNTVKVQHAATEQAVTAGYSDTVIASQSGLPEGDRLPEIQAVISEVNFLAYQLSDNLAKIDAATDVETVYNIVQQPSGIINTGRGGDGQAGPLDLNLSYFPELNDMPGYTQADLELFIPGTNTVIPYDPELPAPYTFDSAGNCFKNNDWRLVIRYAGGGAVLRTITVEEGNNQDVAWTYNPAIPGGGSHSA
jgi:hypothetical protein